MLYLLYYYIIIIYNNIMIIHIYMIFTNQRFLYKPHFHQVPNYWKGGE